MNIKRIVLLAALVATTGCSESATVKQVGMSVRVDTIYTVVDSSGRACTIRSPAPTVGATVKCPWFSR